jgi:hypothetical protein
MDEGMCPFYHSLRMFPTQLVYCVSTKNFTISRHHQKKQATPS